MNSIRFKILPLLIFVYFFSLITGCIDTEMPTGKMPPVLSLNETAPDFKFYLLNNPEKQESSLSDYRGKVIYLDFWASWCKPCIQSMPMFDTLRAALKHDGFEVIAVNLDAVAEKGKEFNKKYPVSFPVVRAFKNRISDLFEINGLPTSYIIDKQGTLRHVHQGFKEEDMPLIKKQILALLKLDIENKKI